MIVDWMRRKHPLIPGVVLGMMSTCLLALKGDKPQDYVDVRMGVARCSGCSGPALTPNSLGRSSSTPERLRIEIVSPAYLVGLFLKSQRHPTSPRSNHMRDPHCELANQGRRMRRSFALACLATILLCSHSQAGTILGFGQTNPADVITLTNNGDGTSTLSTAGNADGGGVSVPILITNLNGAPLLVPIPAFETFVNFTSVGSATSVGGSASQAFNGTVEITSAAGGTGINYLTATFTNLTANMTGALHGALGGSALTFNVSQPPESLVFTSDVIQTLSPPTSLALGFSNVSPSVSIVGSSLGSATMQSAGTFSAVPEPSTLLLSSIALGLIGYGSLWRRRARGA
jgi:hypothetical protein